MKCHEIEEIMLASLDKDGRPETRGAVRDHVTRCESCAQFQKDLMNIRSGLEAMPVSQPPDALVRKTRAACHAVLTGRGKRTPAPSEPIPVLIWAVLIALIILTASFVIPGLVDLDLEQEPTFQSVMVIALIALNTMMLCFAPILIYRYRGKREDFRTFEYNGNGV
jgi:hypothetical protein